MSVFKKKTNRLRCAEQLASAGLMFFTSERFRQNPADNPGPGSYNPENGTWDNAEGAGALKTKSDRFQAQHGLCPIDETCLWHVRHWVKELTNNVCRADAELPGPGAYVGATPSSARPSIARSKRKSAAPAAPAESYEDLESALEDLRESFRALRHAQTGATAEPEQEKAEMARLLTHLHGARARERAQGHALSLCEAALRVQEEAVRSLPQR